MKRIYAVCLLAGMMSSFSLAQTAVLGLGGNTVINSYASVETLHVWEVNDVDSVTLQSIPGDFGQGDTVMLYCVQGSTIKETGGVDQVGAPVQRDDNFGKYAFLIIDSIDVPNRVVIFNNGLNSPSHQHMKPLEPGEVAQLIKVRSYDRAVVRGGGLTADPWDGTKGGVVALFVRSTLRLEADIDVSGLGFWGAAEPSNANPQCSSTDLIQYDSAFYHVGSSSMAGLKGEGTTSDTYSMLRGKARNTNGGGGGNGRFAGGGGGSNYAWGGNGGRESSLCAPGITEPRGLGGWPMGAPNYYYVNYDATSSVQMKIRGDRIFFGGGGGTGTREAGRVTTDGGNGGGIVVIVADTIDGNGRFIRADGASVTDVATGAGGGGGGGGAIVLDVNGYKNNLQVSAVGGDGGNTNHPSEITGPGGGGGGGIYWVAGTVDPELSPDFSEGQPGIYLPSGGAMDPHGALKGDAPGIKYGLNAPLRGFIFNPVPTETWACSNLTPATLDVPRPKGGTGEYGYSWVDSSSTQQQWLPVPGADTNFLEFSGPLADTTYFRRIVTSGSLPPDTSFRIAVNVHPAISNNMVRANDGLSSVDEVCLDIAPLPFVAVGDPGNGDGENYAFRWVVHDGDLQYADAPGSNTEAAYSAQAIQIAANYSFARIVSSGACADTSAPILTTVHPPIAGNTISPFDTVCWNTAPVLLEGPDFSGGKSGDRRYRWESATAESGPWSPTGISTRDYQPGTLVDVTWYRRVALSGTGMAGDACVDISDSLQVLVVDTIENNRILSPDETVCITDQPASLDATAPGGGYNAEYAYAWQSRTASGTWEAADNTHGNDLEDYQPPVMNGESTWFRRVVGSGGPLRDACVSLSNEVYVEVLPAITNNLISTIDDIKCQFEAVGELQGALPGGGASVGGNDPTRNYKWEMYHGQDAPGAGDPWTQWAYGPAEQNFTADSLLHIEDDYWFRRIVFSGPTVDGHEQVCADTTMGAEMIHITIHKAISNYAIDETDSACSQSIKELQGREAVGDPAFQVPVYQWRELGVADLGNGQHQQYTFSGPGPYQFERVVSIGECTETSNVMTVTVMGLPGGTLSSDLSEVCETDAGMFTVDFNKDELSHFDEPWQIYLDDGVNGEVAEAFFQDASGQIAVPLETTGNQPSTAYTYTLSRIQYVTADGQVCVSPGLALTGEVAVMVFNKPRPVIYTLGADVELDSICGSSVALEVYADHGTGRWSSDHDMFMQYDPVDADTAVTAYIPETDEAWAVERYWVSFLSEAGDCFGTDSVELLFYEQPEDAFAGPDTMVWLSNSIRLNADPATAGSGWWEAVSGTGQVQAPDSANTWVYGLSEDQENEFRWTVRNGSCESTDDFTIVSYSEAWRPEGISPNGDGLNDYFIIRGLAQADDWSIRFFNSLGALVRTVTKATANELNWDNNLITGGLADNETVVWDGMASNGKPVPSGTYYYVVSMEITQKDGTFVAPPPFKDYIVVRD